MATMMVDGEMVVGIVQSASAPRVPKEIKEVRTSATIVTISTTNSMTNNVVLRTEQQQQQTKTGANAPVGLLSSVSSSSAPLVTAAPSQIPALATSSPSFLLGAPVVSRVTSTQANHLTALNHLCELSTVENSQLEMDCAMSLVLVRADHKAGDSKEKMVTVSHPTNKNNYSSSAPSPNPFGEDVRMTTAVTSAMTANAINATTTTAKTTATKSLSSSSSPSKRQRTKTNKRREQEEDEKDESEFYSEDDDDEDHEENEEEDEDEEEVEEEDYYDDGESDDEYDSLSLKADPLGLPHHSPRKGNSTKKRSRPTKPLSCRQRSTPEKWSKDEDVKLTRLVRKYSEEALSDMWTRISEQIPNKTASQCFQHWNRVLNPDIKKEPWTVEEESVLVDLTSNAAKNKSWSQIAQSLKGRTDIQCRYQYQKLERSKKAAWTKYEDELLLDLVVRQQHVRDDYNNNNNNNNNSDSSTGFDKYDEKKLAALEVPLSCWVNVSQDLYKSLIKNKSTQYKTPPRGALECKIRWETHHCKKPVSPVVISNYNNSNNNNNSAEVKEEEVVTRSKNKNIAIHSSPKRTSSASSTPETAPKNKRRRPNVVAPKIEEQVLPEEDEEEEREQHQLRQQQQQQQPHVHTPSEICTACQEVTHDTLLTCTECKYAYHMKCLNPPRKNVPKGKWYCVTCIPNHQLSDISDDSTPSSPVITAATTATSTMTTNHGRPKRSRVTPSAFSSSAYPPSSSPSTPSPSSSPGTTRASLRQRTLIPQKFGGAPEYDRGDRVIVQWSDGLWYKAHVMESTGRSSLVKFTDGSIQKVNNELISTDDENDSEDEEDGKEREDDDEEDVTEDEQTEGNRANDPNNVWTAISKRRRDHHHRAHVSPFSLCN